MYTAVIGAKLLGRVVKRLIDGKDPKLHLIHSSNEKDMYYPMPGDKDFESYFKQRRYFRIRDVLTVLVMKKYR